MTRTALVFRLAFRNVGAYAVKNLIIGVILVFGTFILITGAALLSSLDVAMRKSITTSVTGDIQVYAKDARDPLALLGDMNFGGSDYGELGDFAPVAAALEDVPEVAEVLPMGLGNATVFGANDIDRTLEDLRAAQRAGDPARELTLITRLQRIAADIRPELDRVAAITSDKGKLEQDRANLDRVTADGFPAEYQANPVATIDWMDGNIAPLATDGKLAYFRLLGTDLDAFARTFPRFEVIKGEPVPHGHRGILLNETMVEQWIKNPLARALDGVLEAVTKDGEVIGTGGTLYDKVQRMSRQYRRVLYQLDASEAEALTPKLRALLGGADGDLTALLKTFLSVTDENVAARHAFFYAEIAPLIRLYDIGVGDTLPLRSFTKSGYLKSLNVKVYGIYRYKGVTDEDTAAAAYCLVDMPTFRDLYGKMTDAQRDELADIKAAVGVKDIGDANIEDVLFGGGGSIETTVAPDATAGGGLSALDDTSFGRMEDRGVDTVTQEDIVNGLALNAAVILKDRSAIGPGLAAVSAALEKANLPLKAVDWREASGIIGQAATVVQLVLGVAVGVLFLVATVIINNALVMATMERTNEIGTMRALGAQSSFVLGLFLIESQIVALASSLVGAGLAALVVGWLGKTGIPAGADVLNILFGGGALYPTLSFGNVAVGVGLVSVVTFLATLYSAWMAASVPPVVALGGKE